MHDPIQQAQEARPNDVIAHHNTKRSGKIIDMSAGYPKPLYYVPRPQEIPTVKDVFLDAAMQPYLGEQDPETGDYVYQDDRMIGMNMLQAATHRTAVNAAYGDRQAFDTMLDRIYGKPKQSLESVQVRVSYSDFLDNLANSDITVTTVPNPQTPESNIDHNPMENPPHAAQTEKRYQNIDDL